MELSEFVSKLIQIGALCIAVVILIMHSISFVGNLQSYENQKSAIDFSQAILSDPCLIYKVEGDGRKGILEFDKLEAGELCVNIDGEYFVEIEVKNKYRLDSWEFGEKIDEGESVSVPVLIKYDEETLLPGKVSVLVNVIK